MSDAAPFHEEEVLGKVYDGRLMRRLLSYVKPHRAMLVAAVVLVIVSSLLQAPKSTNPVTTSTRFHMIPIPRWR